MKTRKLIKGTSYAYTRAKNNRSVTREQFYATRKENTLHDEKTIHQTKWGLGNEEGRKKQHDTLDNTAQTDEITSVEKNDLVLRFGTTAVPKFGLASAINYAMTCLTR
jgi:hypothetical protein